MLNTTNNLQNLAQACAVNDRTSPPGASYVCTTSRFIIIIFPLFVLECALTRHFCLWCFCWRIVSVYYCNTVVHAKRAPKGDCSINCTRHFKVRLRTRACALACAFLSSCSGRIASNDLGETKETHIHNELAHSHPHTLGYRRTTSSGILFNCYSLSIM